MLLILTFFFYGCSNTQEENQTYQNNSENNLNTDTVPPKSVSIKRIWGEQKTLLFQYAIMGYQTTKIL